MSCFAEPGLSLFEQGHVTAQDFLVLARHKILAGTLAGR